MAGVIPPSLSDLPPNVAIPKDALGLTVSKQVAGPPAQSCLSQQAVCGLQRQCVCLWSETGKCLQLCTPGLLSHPHARILMSFPFERLQQAVCKYTHRGSDLVFISGISISLYSKYAKTQVFNCHLNHNSMVVHSSPFLPELPLNCWGTIQGICCHVRICTALFCWRYKHANDNPLCLWLSKMKGGLADFFWVL